jgi:hypothetical protein
VRSLVLKLSDIKIFIPSLILPMRATCPADFNVLILNILIITSWNKRLTNDVITEM